MPNPASVNFAEAHRALLRSADADPVWFDRARDVLRRTDDGSVLLMQAMLEGLKAAYEAGLRGGPPPPLERVEPSAPEEAATPVAKPPRVVRGRPAPEAPAASQRPRRVVRRAR